MNIFRICYNLSDVKGVFLIMEINNKNPNLQKGDETNSFTTYDDTIDMF